MYIDLPDFDKELIDLNMGDDKEFKLALPDDYKDEKIAGKEISFSVNIQDIKEIVLPELTSRTVCLSSSSARS